MCCSCFDCICGCNYCKTNYIKIGYIYRIIIIMNGILLLLLPCQESEINKMLKYCENYGVRDFDKNFKSYDIVGTVIIFIMCFIDIILWIVLRKLIKSQISFNIFKKLNVGFMIITLILAIIGYFLLCFVPFSECEDEINKDLNDENELDNDSNYKDDIFFYNRQFFFFLLIIIICIFCLCIDWRFISLQQITINYDNQNSNHYDLETNNNDRNENTQNPDIVITNNENQYNSNGNSNNYDEILILNHQIDQKKKEKMNLLMIRAQKLEEKKRWVNFININQINQLKNEIKTKENEKKQLEDNLENIKKRNEELKNEINIIKNNKIETERKNDEIKEENNEIKLKILECSSLMNEVSRLNEQLDIKRKKTK